METTKLADAILALVRPEIERIVEREVAKGVAKQLRLFSDDWMSLDEAARYVRLSTVALSARARRGTFPAYKDGHRWMFRRSELDGAIGRRPLMEG